MEPWFPNNLIEWLERHLTGKEAVFEWGSGGSTKWFGEHCGKVVSVEHHKGYYDDLKSDMPGNVEYLLREPGRKSLKRSSSPKSNKSAILQMDMSSYVEAIDSYDSFDLIIVDGRARPSCILHAIPKLKEGGLLLVDNSHRFRYRRAIRMLSDWEHVQFYGGGGASFYWQSTVWIKKINKNPEPTQYKRIILSTVQIAFPFIGRNRPILP